MDGCGGSVAVTCHIVHTGHFVELLACVDVAFRKFKVSHDLNEYSVVHASDGSFEVRVSRVDVFLFTSWRPRTS